MLRLKDQLSLTFAGVTLLALVASFALVSFLVHRDEMRELDHGLLSQAHTAAELARARERFGAVVDGDADVPEQLIPLQRYVAIYDPDGHVVAQSKTFSGQAPALSSLGVGNIASLGRPGHPVDLLQGKEHLRGVVVAVGMHGRSLLFAASREPFDADMSYLYRVFSAILLATGLTVSLAARYLGQKLVGDVEVIADVARAVTEGDLTARIRDRARSSLETAQLAGGVDHMIAELGALVTAQRTFISHAAHELRSPLATVRGELQLALRRPRDVDGYRETIRGVLEEVELLSALTEDLLALARLQRGPESDAATPLAGAIADALHMSAGPAKQRGVHVSDPGVDAAVTVRGTRPDVARAIRNLVDNAVAHSPPGGRVEVSAAAEGDTIVVAVTDEGNGVPPEDVQHIFAPFFRGAREQSSEGGSAGLGLAIAREIARSAGGEIVLDTTHGAGARFVLTLERTSAPQSTPRI